MKNNNIVSFFYLKIFILVVFLMIIGSLFIRITNEIISSSFKNNSFSVLIVARDSKLIYVDKASKSALFLAIGDIRSFVKGKGPIEASLALGIPINGMIIDEKSPTNLKEFSSYSNISRLIFNDRIVFKNLDKYDVYKLASAVRGSVTDNTHEIRLNIFNQDQMKEKVGDLFKDSIINNMDYTVEVDNATSIDGLGTEFAGILNRLGYNVIAVRTSTKSSNSFVAYSGKKDIYINFLIQFTGFEYRQEKVSQAADITVFLGDDLDSMLSF